MPNTTGSDIERSPDAVIPGTCLAKPAAPDQDDGLSRVEAVLPACVPQLEWPRVGMGVMFWSLAACSSAMGLGRRSAKQGVELERGALLCVG